ncbi:hypothetical protein BH10CHL1_BH10CHL1_16620 [soil metagenome]
MKFQDKSIKVWHILTGVGLTLGLALTLLISLQPSKVLAQAAVAKITVPAQTQQSGLTKAAGARKGNQRLFMITGTVVAANADQIQINLTLPKRLARKGQDKAGLAVSKPMTFTVSATSLLFDKDLNKIAPANLQIGGTVTVFPKRAWGEPSIQLLFVGEPSQLATFEFHGQLVEERSDTLVLKPKDGEQFNVSVDPTTTWLAKGVVGRPAQIRSGLPLHVLGTKGENGDVKAVLITAMEPIARMGRRAR